MDYNYVLSQIEMLQRLLARVAGEVSDEGRGRVAMTHLTRAMTEVESAKRHILAKRQVEENANVTL